MSASPLFARVTSVAHRLAPDGRDILIIAGLGLLTYGVALESHAVAFMVCGAVLLGIGLAGVREVVRRTRG